MISGKPVPRKIRNMKQDNAIRMRGKKLVVDVVRGCDGGGDKMRGDRGESSELSSIVVAQDLPYK